MPPNDAPTVRIKICGLTNAADAAAAIDAGADALGFNFFVGSRRYLERGEAASWLREVPPTVRRVAVLVNPTFDEAQEIAALPYIDGLQLHGQETPRFCAALARAGVRFGKALPMVQAAPTADPVAYSTDTIVLDAQNDRGFGGTGESFPWSAASVLVQQFPKVRFVLAGGLSPENVAAAIALVRPFAVDVTTGVELVAGRKDYVKLRAFIAAARAA